jgi:hypothetical protein
LRWYWIIPTQLQLPETLEEDLHQDDSRQKETKDVKELGDIRDEITFGHDAQRRKLRHCESEAVVVSIPCDPKGLDVLIRVWNAVSGLRIPQLRRDMLKDASIAGIPLA